MVHKEKQEYKIQAQITVFSKSWKKPRHREGLTQRSTDVPESAVSTLMLKSTEGTENYNIIIIQQGSQLWYSEILRHIRQKQSLYEWFLEKKHSGVLYVSFFKYILIIVIISFTNGSVFLFYIY